MAADHVGKMGPVRLTAASGPPGRSSPQSPAPLLPPPETREKGSAAGLGQRFLRGRAGWIGAALLFLLGAPASRAHQGFLGFWQLEVETRQVRSLISISLLDLNFIPELDVDQDGVLSYQEVLNRREEIASRVARHFRVSGQGASEGSRLRDFQVLETGELLLEFEHRFTDDLRRLEVESTFHELTDLNHRVFCRVDFGGETEQFLLDVQTPRHEIDLTGSWISTLEQMRRFIRLGVEHIFTGYDHLAFLLGLIILGGTLRQLVGIVSSFTVAHSITLSLATFQLVVLPSRFIESAIALSICYIALENIFFREIDGRWKITFLFGLIHGFGFSNVLRELELPRRHLATSLFSFNLGVEIGQVAIMALVFPLIFYAARQNWHRHAVTAVSALLAGFGFFWLLERLS